MGNAISDCVGSNEATKKRLVETDEGILQKEDAKKLRSKGGMLNKNSTDQNPEDEEVDDDDDDDDDDDESDNDDEGNEADEEDVEDEEEDERNDDDDDEEAEAEADQDSLLEPDDGSSASESITTPSVPRPWRALLEIAQQYVTDSSTESSPWTLRASHDIDYRAFCLVLHPTHGLLLLHCTRKKNKEPHYQLPGGHVDRDEYDLYDDNLYQSAQAGAARELYEETGLDLRQTPALDRLLPLILYPEYRDGMPTWKPKGRPLPNEFKSRLFFIATLSDDEFLKKPEVKRRTTRIRNHGLDLYLPLSPEHSGFWLESNPFDAKELLHLHSGGKVSQALAMALDVARGYQIKPDKIPNRVSRSTKSPVSKVIHPISPKRTTNEDDDDELSDENDEPQVPAPKRAENLDNETPISTTKEQGKSAVSDALRTKSATPPTSPARVQQLLKEEPSPNRGLPTLLSAESPTRVMETHEPIPPKSPPKSAVALLPTEQEDSKPDSTSVALESPPSTPARKSHPSAETPPPKPPVSLDSSAQVTESTDPIPTESVSNEGTPFDLSSIDIFGIRPFASSPTRNTEPLNETDAPKASVSNPVSVDSASRELPELQEGIPTELQVTSVGVVSTKPEESKEEETTSPLESPAVQEGIPFALSSIDIFGVRPFASSPGRNAPTSDETDPPEASVSKPVSVDSTSQELPETQEPIPTELQVKSAGAAPVPPKPEDSNGGETTRVLPPPAVQEGISFDLSSLDIFGILPFASSPTQPLAKSHPPETSVAKPVSMDSASQGRAVEASSMSPSTKLEDSKSQSVSAVSGTFTRVADDPTIQPASAPVVETLLSKSQAPTPSNYPSQSVTLRVKRLPAVPNSASAPVASPGPIALVAPPEDLFDEDDGPDDETEGNRSQEIAFNEMKDRMPQILDVTLDLDNTAEHEKAIEDMILTDFSWAESQDLEVDTVVHHVRPELSTEKVMSPEDLLEAALLRAKSAAAAMQAEEAISPGVATEEDRHRKRLDLEANALFDGNQPLSKPWESSEEHKETQILRDELDQARLVAEKYAKQEVEYAGPGHNSFVMRTSGDSPPSPKAVTTPAPEPYAGFDAEHEPGMLPVVPSTESRAHTTTRRNNSGEENEREHDALDVRAAREQPQSPPRNSSAVPKTAISPRSPKAVVPPSPKAYADDEEEEPPTLRVGSSRERQPHTLTRSDTLEEEDELIHDTLDEFKAAARQPQSPARNSFVVAATADSPRSPEAVVPPSPKPFATDNDGHEEPGILPVVSTNERRAQTSAPEPDAGFDAEHEPGMLPVVPSTERRAHTATRRNNSGEENEREHDALDVRAAREQPQSPPRNSSAVPKTAISPRSPQAVVPPSPKAYANDEEEEEPPTLRVGSSRERQPHTLTRSDTSEEEDELIHDTLDEFKAAVRQPQSPARNSFVVAATADSPRSPEAVVPPSPKQYVADAQEPGRPIPRVVSSRELQPLTLAWTNTEDEEDEIAHDILDEFTAAANEQASVAPLVAPTSSQQVLPIVSPLSPSAGAEKKGLKDSYLVIAKAKREREETEKKRSDEALSYEQKQREANRLVSIRKLEAGIQRLEAERKELQRTEALNAAAAQRSPPRKTSLPVHLSTSGLYVAPTPHVGNSLILLISKTSGAPTQRSNQEKTLVMLQGKKLPFLMVDGSDASERDLRDKLFGISGIRGNYPQLFLKQHDGTTSFVGDFDMIEYMNETGALGGLISQGGDNVSRPREETTASADGTTIVHGKSLVVLLSTTSGNSVQKANQDRALVMLDSSRIRPEILDGSDQSIKDLRNDLFGVSGIRGRYPQFFLRRVGTSEYSFFGTFETLESLNDNGRLEELFEG